MNCALSSARNLPLVFGVNKDVSYVTYRAKQKRAAVRDCIQKTRWTSDQEIKIFAQHFKGVRALKVQSIADALVALGQAA